MDEYKNHQVNVSEDSFLPQAGTLKSNRFAKSIGVIVVMLLMLTFVHKLSIAYRFGNMSDAMIWLIKDLGQLLIFLCFAILSFSFHAVTHELGHALAGISRGMKIVLLGVGKWRYERTLRGFRWRKGTPIKGIAGVASLMINTTHPNAYTRFDFIVFLAGGVFVNLLLGTMFHVLSTHVVITSTLDLVFREALRGFAAIGLFLGIFNLLPLKVNGWYVDGLMIWRTLQGKGWDLNRRNLYLGSLLFAGTPPRLLPYNELSTLEELRREDVPLLFQMSAHQLRLMFALDTQDQNMAEASAAWCAQHFYQLPDGIRQSIALQMAFFAIRFLQSKEVFNAWRPLSENGLYNLTVSKYQLDAEYACLCGDVGVARKNIQRAREALLELPTQAHVDEVKEQLLRLEEACQEN